MSSEAVVVGEGRGRAVAAIVLAAVTAVLTVLFAGQSFFSIWNLLSFAVAVVGLILAIISCTKRAGSIGVVAVVLSSLALLFTFIV